MFPCLRLQTASERILPNLSTYLGAAAKKQAEETLGEMEEGQPRQQAVEAMAEHELKQALGHFEVVRNKSCSMARWEEGYELPAYMQPAWEAWSVDIHSRQAE